jgi:hypothetical protein
MASHPGLSIDRVKLAFVSQDFDFPMAPKINTVPSDVTISPKTVADGQDKVPVSSKCSPSTISTRTRSVRRVRFPKKLATYITY